MIHNQDRTISNTTPTKVTKSRVRELTKIAAEVYDNRDNPGVLADLFMELGAQYSYYSEQLRPIKVAKPTEWINIKNSNGDKLLSDKYTEMKWRTTPDGQTEQDIKYKLQGIDKLCDSIKQAGYLNQQELKIQG